MLEPKLTRPNEYTSFSSWKGVDDVRKVVGYCYSLLDIRCKDRKCGDCFCKESRRVNGGTILGCKGGYTISEDAAELINQGKIKDPAVIEAVASLDVKSRNYIEDVPDALEDLAIKLMKNGH